MGSWQLLLEIVLLLGACVVLGGICSRLRQSPLLGYLLAGMLLGGPGSFHLVTNEADIEGISELGVALLLFSLGLEFSWKSLMAMGRRALYTGVLQIVATTMIVGVIAWAWGAGARAAIVIGGMISLSSTAAVLRVLADRGELDSQHGRRTVAILLVQDMAVVPLAIIVELASGGGGAADVIQKLAWIALASAALILGLFLVLNYVAVKALRSLSVVHNRELVVLLAVVVGLGATWSAHAAGLSPALGAFAAGLFLGNSPFASQIRADVSSLRIVLLTLFFGSVGMVADAQWIFAHPGTVLLTSCALIGGKAIVTTLCVRVFEPSLTTSVATGMCLAQVGEFAFVLGSSAEQSKVLSEDAYLTLVSSTIVTLFVTPYLIPAATLVVRRLRLARGESIAAEAPEFSVKHVLVVGFGPAGQAVGRELVQRDCAAHVVDVNPSARTTANAMGLTGEIGDATQWDVLEHLGVHHALLVVITIPDFDAAMTILDHVRRLSPTARIVVRSRYERNEPIIAGAGADAVFGDEREIGEALARSTASMLDEIRAHAEPDAAATEGA